MDQILGYNQPQPGWVTVGRWSLGALVIALGWTVLGASTSAHASDGPDSGLLGGVSDVADTLTHVSAPITTPVAAVPAAVVPVVTSAAAPLVNAAVPTIGATTAVVTPIVPPVPAIVLESVTAATPPVVETLVTTIAGTPLVSAVTTPVVALVTPLDGIPVIGPVLVTPILDTVDPILEDLPSECTSLLGRCISVDGDVISAGGDLHGQAGPTLFADSSGAVTTTAGSALALSATASSTPYYATNSASARAPSPERPAAPAGHGVLASTTSVTTNGGSAGANSATVPAEVFCRPAMADAPHGHSFSAHSTPADDLSSSPD